MASQDSIERTASRWIFPEPPDERAAAELAYNLRLPPIAARILIRRGFVNTETAGRFLDPGIEELHDPFALRDMDRAVDRIRRAISQREPIEIHGDYDVDGVTSTVILKKTLDALGANANWQIPHRLRDGYGMQEPAVEDAAVRGIRLIISVDNGIRARRAIERANALGIDAIVTDHHVPEAELPPAFAVINPKRRDCAYPNPDLCGAGVAFKLAHGLLARSGWPESRRNRFLDSLLKLVAIATVADIVHLTGENRVIVKHGLRGLAQVRNPGLRALLDLAGFRGRLPDATEVAFRIAPAINASGRMDSAAHAVRMFLTDDAAEAARIAGELVSLNQQRQAAERQIVNEIFARCAETPVADRDAALVFWGDGWHRGVVGIVASRVVERFHRPAVVLGVDGGIAHGSARSIPRFHLLAALESMQELFTKFGGHAHAAGLTLAASSLETFRNRLQAHAAERLTIEDMCETVEIDALVDLPSIGDELWQAIERIGPFGMGNAKPVFAARNIGFAGPPQVWKEKHLRIAAGQGGRTLMMTAWGMAEKAVELRAIDRADVAFEIERDFLGGWCVNAKAIRAADANPKHERIQ